MATQKPQDNTARMDQASSATHSGSADRVSPPDDSSASGRLHSSLNLNTDDHVPLHAAPDLTSQESADVDTNTVGQATREFHPETVHQTQVGGPQTIAGQKPLNEQPIAAGNSIPTDGSSINTSQISPGHHSDPTGFYIPETLPKMTSQLPPVVESDSHNVRIFKQDTDNESLFARSMINGQSSLKSNRYGNSIAGQRGLKYPVPQASSIFSGYESSMDVLSTMSIHEGMDYPTENKRTYASLAPDSYYMPNDETEQDRLNLMHQLHYSILNSRLTLAPIQPDITHVLDVGTGTGEWAINMAEVYPSAEVIGTDISAIQPSAVPSNVFFEIDDAELEWAFSKKFDFIHMRDLAGAFADWPALYAQAFKFLKPGGYLEVIDHDRPVAPGLRNTKVLAPTIMAWEKSLVAAGRPHDTAHLQPSVFEAAGFTEITTHEGRITLGGKSDSASADDLFKQKFGLVTLLETMASSILRPLTRDANWSEEEVNRTVDECKQEIAALMHAPEGGYTPVHFIVARKPLSAE